MGSSKQSNGARILPKALKQVGRDDPTRAEMVDNRRLGKSIQLPKGGTKESGKNRQMVGR